MNTLLPWNLLLVKVVLLSIFGAGAFLCAMNFYLSFLRYPWYCLRGRKSEYRFVSGAPLLGSLVVLVFLIPPAFPPLRFVPQKPRFWITSCLPTIHPELSIRYTGRQPQGVADLVR